MVSSFTIQKIDYHKRIRELLDIIKTYKDFFEKEGLETQYISYLNDINKDISRQLENNDKI